MCRLAAFPSNFPRRKALNVLLEFECRNTDGTGFTYVKDGEFVTEKWPKSLSKLMRTKSLLSHMPHPGWTIAHLRAASHGNNTMENTHPFIIGDWAICHNGIWSDYDIAKLALNKYVKFKGETDSEVAAHLINNLGPKKFAAEINSGGVFLALNRDGTLWLMHTSGEAQVFDYKGQALIASELNDEKYPDAIDLDEGWYHFDQQGKPIANKKIDPWWMRTQSRYHDGGGAYGNLYTPVESGSSYRPDEEARSKGIPRSINRYWDS